MLNEITNESMRQASGLTNAEAEERLKKYGPNLLKKKKKISPLGIFLEQFNDFIIWVLLGATLVSGLMGEKADAITIVIIVIMNAVLGFIQEFKTEKSLEALKVMAAPTAKVIRNNRIEVVNAEKLVPGDLVILETGDRVPADCKMIRGKNVLVDESLLTGESVGVEKAAGGKNTDVYMGTTLLRGKCKAVVFETGMGTEMGKIATMLDSINDEKSPLKEKLGHLGKIMVIICIAICILVTLMGIYRGQDKYEMFLVGVSLAVAAIPEGLAAIVTVSLALGVSRMLKRKALIRKLPAVETLGCTSVICSDKTGTLTQNKMTVKRMYCNNKMIELDGKGKNEELTLLKKIFTFCSECTVDTSKSKIDDALYGTPTEMALIKAFFKTSKALKAFLDSAHRMYDIPFDSSRKMMSVIMEHNGRRVCYIKGAPEKIIDRCRYINVNGKIELLDNTHRKMIQKAIDEMSLNAYRCVAGAYKEKNIRSDASCEKDLVFAGIAGMIDPPREEVKDAVERCIESGIKVVMITGDHKNTAYAIAKDLNICRKQSQVITGEELDIISDKELNSLIDKIRVFARVTPAHKLRIVKAFKNKKYVAAMTGDGVNDAPAVKEADIGISMGINGTDVTKEASSMILLDDNFTTIVAAVEEGRTIYDNIRKFIRYLLSCNLGEVLTMFLASMFYLPTPLLPIQILFINLATDGLPAIALGVDPPDTDIMERAPRRKGESIFARGLKEKIMIRGTLIGICTVFAYMFGMYYKMTLETCRTIALGTLVMSQLIHVFECRSERHSIFEIDLFTNIPLLGAVLISVMMLFAIIYIPFMQVVFHTVPLKINQWLIVAFFSSIIAFINSIYMYFTKHKY